MTRHLQSGRPPEAVAQFKEALRIDPRSARKRDNLRRLQDRQSTIGRGRCGGT
jgi:hypothetical protein